MTSIKPKKTCFISLILLFLLVRFSLCSIVMADAQTAVQSGYNLIGTIESTNFAGAVLRNSSGEQTLYQLDERLPDGSRIVSVRDNSISLKSSEGTVYDLYIAHETNPVVSVERAIQPIDPYTSGAAMPALSGNKQKPHPKGRLGRLSRPRDEER